MTKSEIMEKIKGGLIVSCQALPNEPLFGSEIMAKMAIAGRDEGAVGIRANTVADITEIRKNVSLPMIGIIKKVYSDSDVYITPTMVEVDALVETGVEIIALDATDRIRHGGLTLEKLIACVKEKYPSQVLMADCSSYEDCVNAEKLGFDFIGTTLAGYTPNTKGRSLPDLELIRKLKENLSTPIIAEGGIHYPNQLTQVYEAGCFSAVIGGAITRPQEIARRFIEVLKTAK